MTVSEVDCITHWSLPTITVISSFSTLVIFRPYNYRKVIHRVGGIYGNLETKGEARGFQIYIYTNNEVYNRFKLCAKLQFSGMQIYARMV